MGCGGSEENNETTIVKDDGVGIVEEEAPPDGWVQVDVLCDKHIVRLYIGEKHDVRQLVSFVSKTLSAVPEFGGPCEIKGLSSTWALEDGGLVFCEDDTIFELDGWEPEKPKIQFVALTDTTKIEAWTEDGAIPETDDGFTVIESNDYHWGAYA